MTTKPARGAVLLINPPSARPSEPPAALGHLAGALGMRGAPCALIDANIEGLLWLIEGGRATAPDTWTRRALKAAPRHLAALRERAIYASPDRYSRAVLDLDRAARMAAAAHAPDVTVGLANYENAALPPLREHAALPPLREHAGLSPLRSADLLRAAERYEENPFSPYFMARLGEAVERETPSVVGLSVTYLSQALTAFAMAGYLRKRFPGIKIVMGGGLVTSWLRRPGWRDPFGGLVDMLVAGPGEEALLGMLGEGGGGGLSAPPDYSGLPLPLYLSPGLILPYAASRGCPWGRCSFCPERAEGNRYTQIPAVEAARSIGRLSAQYRPALIHLLDSAVSPALLRALVDNPPGAPWYGFARVTRELGDDEFCRALARSGCAMLKLGIESGDQGVLDAMGKGIEIATVQRALGALRGAGIAAYVYLLFGTPAESEEEARRTLDFTARHAGEIGFLNLAVFNMPACAPEAGGLATRAFSEADLSLYRDFEHPRGWDRARVKRFVDREFSRHPAIAPILRRTPPLFTSGHAPLFTSY